MADSDDTLFKGLAPVIFMYSDRDGYVERAAFLADVGVHETDDGVALGNVKARVAYRREDTVLAFLHSSVRQPNNDEAEYRGFMVNLDGQRDAVDP